MSTEFSERTAVVCVDYSVLNGEEPPVDHKYVILEYRIFSSLVVLCANVIALYSAVVNLSQLIVVINMSIRSLCTELCLLHCTQWRPEWGVSLGVQPPPPEIRKF